MNIKFWLPVVMLLAFMVGGGAYWWLSRGPPPSPPSLTAAPAPKVEALSWEALVAKLDQLDVREVRQHGVRVFQQGDPDKAFLLFKTAARRGDGWSAFAVGEMYDPATFAAPDFDPKRTAFSKPNARKALEWYDLALRNGEQQADAARARLLAELRRAASSGDVQAQRILKKIR